MRALTLRQPWAYAVTHLGKRVENRMMKPPRNLIGRRIAIHAGLAWDALGARTIVECGLANGGRFSDPMGASDPYYRYVDDGAEHHEAITRGAVVATAVLNGYVLYGSAGAMDPWFVGPIGILLADVIALPKPVPARGMQGYWPVPANVAEKVIEYELSQRTGLTACPSRAAIEAWAREHYLP